MSTNAQVLANRQNSTRSTGPRTVAGKQTSAANATRHGLSSAAAVTVLDTQDRDQFNALFEQYCAEFQPSGEHEMFLVRQMAASRHRLERIQQHQDALLDRYLENPAGPDAHTLEILHRYATAAERSYYRAHKELTAARKTAATTEAATIQRDILAYLNAPIELPPRKFPNEPNSAEPAYFPDDSSIDFHPVSS